MSTDLLIIRALERGITLSDFDNLTIGMIMDILITFNNENMTDEVDDTRYATQEDYDNW